MAKVDQADGLRSLGRQPARREHRAQRPHNLSAHHRHRQNRVGRQFAGWARVQVRVRLEVLRIFRRVAANQLNVRDSALLRQRGRLDPSAAVLNIEHRLDYVSRPVRRLRAGLLTNCKPREKEGRAPMVNPADSRREVERKLQASSAAHGNQSAPPISRSAEAKNQKKEHRRRVHNNSGAIFTAAPEEKSGAAFFYRYKY